MSSRGRRPGTTDTRAAILAAARERFAANGYERTRVRDVAADAGVDSALVHYFFKTKDGLFAAAVELPMTPSSVIGPLVDRGVDGLGERAARRVLEVWSDPVNRASLLAAIAGARARPEAGASLQEFVREEVVGRIAGAVEADRPLLRANLFASQLVGVIAARYIARVEPLASMPADEVVSLVAPTLQRYLEGPL